MRKFALYFNAAFAKMQRADCQVTIALSADYEIQNIGLEAHEVPWPTGALGRCRTSLEFAAHPQGN